MNWFFATLYMDYCAVSEKPEWSDDTGQRIERYRGRENLILKKLFDPSIIFYFDDDASQTG